MELAESNVLACILDAVGDSAIGEVKLKRMSHHAETLPDVCVLQINVVIVFFSGRFSGALEYLTLRVCQTGGCSIST